MFSERFYLLLKFMICNILVYKLFYSVSPSYPYCTDTQRFPDENFISDVVCITVQRNHKN